jgi:hypothetical protein
LPQQYLRAATQQGMEDGHAASEIRRWLLLVPPWRSRRVLRAISGERQIIADIALLRAVIAEGGSAAFHQIVRLAKAFGQDQAEVAALAGDYAAAFPEEARAYLAQTIVGGEVEIEVFARAVTPHDLPAALRELSFESGPTRGRALRRALEFCGPMPPAVSEDLLLAFFDPDLELPAPAPSDIAALTATARPSVVEQRLFDRLGGRLDGADELAWWMFGAAARRALRVGASLEPYLEVAQIRSGLRTGAATDVLQKIGADDWRSLPVASVWHWLSRLAEDLACRRDQTLAQATEAAIDATLNRIDAEAVQYWVSVVSTAQSQGLAERVSAVSFARALGARQSPVGPVLIVSFPRLYAELPEARQTTFFDFFFPSYGWDRRRDFRRGLVDAFVTSNWRAGDLALAADGAGILKKVVAQLVTSKQSSYVLRMINDLGTRGLDRTVGLADRVEALWRAADDLTDD